MSKAPHITRYFPKRVVEWATNDDYAGGDSIGTPTKLEPSAGVAADGHRPEEPLGAQWENHFKNAFARYLYALQDLPFSIWTPYDLQGSLRDVTRNHFDQIFAVCEGATGVVYELFQANPSQIISHSITASAGTMTPHRVLFGTAVGAPRLVIVGDNSGGPAIWSSATGRAAELAEQTHPEFAQFLDAVYDAENETWVAIAALAGQATNTVLTSTNTTTWTATTRQPFDHDDGAIAAADGKIVIARRNGTNIEVAVSDDAGASFGPIHSFATGSLTPRSIDYSKEHGLWLMAAGEAGAGPGPGRLFAALDPAVSWLSFETTGRPLDFVAAIGGLVVTARLRASGSDNTGGLYLTEDFVNWRAISLQAPGALSSLHKMFFDGRSLWTVDHTDGASPPRTHFRSAPIGVCPTEPGDLF